MAIEIKVTLVEDGRAIHHEDAMALRAAFTVVADGNIESGNIELLAKDGLADALRAIAMGTVLSLSFTTLGPKGRTISGEGKALDA